MMKTADISSKNWDKFHLAELVMKKTADISDPHSHAGVLSQSADAQNSPPLYYTIIFRYWSNACIKFLDTKVMPA